MPRIVRSLGGKANAALYSASHYKFQLSVGPTKIPNMPNATRPPITPLATAYTLLQAWMADTNEEDFHQQERTDNRVGTPGL